MLAEIKELREDIKQLGYKVHCRENVVFAINMFKEEVDIFTLLQDHTWRYSTLDQALYAAQRVKKGKGIVKKASMEKAEILNMLYRQAIKTRKWASARQRMEFDENVEFDDDYESEIS